MYETKRQAFQRATRAVERARDRVTATDLDTADGRTLGEAVDMLRAIDSGEVDAFDGRVVEAEAALYVAVTDAQEAHGPEAPICRALTAALCVVHMGQVRTDAEASVIADDAEEIESKTRPAPTWQTGLSETMVEVIRAKISYLTTSKAASVAVNMTWPIQRPGHGETRAHHASMCQGGIDALTELLTLCGVPVEPAQPSA